MYCVSCNCCSSSWGRFLLPPEGRARPKTGGAVDNGRSPHAAPPTKRGVIPAPRARNTHWRDVPPAGCRQSSRGGAQANGSPGRLLAAGNRGRTGRTLTGKLWNGAQRVRIATLSRDCCQPLQQRGAPASRAAANGPPRRLCKWTRTVDTDGGHGRWTRTTRPRTSLHQARTGQAHQSSAAQRPTVLRVCCRVTVSVSAQSN